MKKILMWIGIGILLIAAKNIYNYMPDNSVPKESSISNRADESINFHEIDDSKLEEIIEVYGSIPKMQDALLVEGDMVDSDYRYKDSPHLKAFYKEITAKLQMGLPSEVDGIIATGVEITPYIHTYTYALNEILDLEVIKNVKAITKTEEFLQEQCEQLYASKYQRANDVKVHISIYDLSEKLLASVILDKQVCR